MARRQNASALSSKMTTSALLARRRAYVPVLDAPEPLARPVSGALGAGARRHLRARRPMLGSRVAEQRVRGRHPSGLPRAWILPGRARRSRVRLSRDTRLLAGVALPTRARHPLDAHHAVLDAQRPEAPRAAP